MRPKNAPTPVKSPVPYPALAWVAVLVCSLGFLIWTDSSRLRRIEYVSGLGGWTEPPPANVADALPATDLAPNNWLIVPAHNNESYRWIAQTQQMFAQGEARVRHIDYENAPFGHELHATSPYRWWLGSIAWIKHQTSGRTIGPSVEQAALIADPLLHLLLLTATAIFVAWRFGPFPAALFSLGFATMFPLAAQFLPGAPDDHSLFQVFAIWSVLPLLLGARAAVAEDSRSAGRWFLVAGVAGGLGLWVNVSAQGPVLAGIAVGALLAAWVARGSSKEAKGRPALPWRIWALGGGATGLATYLIEFFPAHLGGWQLRSVHPLHAIAWMGGAELLRRATSWVHGDKPVWNWRGGLVLLLAVAAVAGWPVVMWKTNNLGFMATDIPAFRLTKLPDGIVARSLWAWLLRDGVTATVGVVVLPLLLAVPAIWLLVRPNGGIAARMAVALALGPVLVALGFACWQLIWWNALDAFLLVALIATTAALQETVRTSVSRWVGAGLAALVFFVGALKIIPSARAGTDNALGESEVFGLIERDLGRWIALHAIPGGAVALAPPNETTTFHYYGGVRGLGTLFWENQDGLSAAVRLVSASTPEEVKELIDRRGVTHIVIPSWDPYLDEYARMGMGQVEGTFLSRVHDWRLTPWLRPVAYQLPAIPGFEGQSVTIFEVVEDQDDAVALSRTAEYFVEMGQLDRAAAVAQALRRFPANFGAWVARAEVEIARNDEDGLAGSLKFLIPKLAAKADRNLLWDQRVALAVVLARAKQAEPAREQVRRCVAEMDATKLRMLPTGSLYRLLVLSRAFGIPIADPQLKELALGLLTPEFRSRL